MSVVEVDEILGDFAAFLFVCCEEDFSCQASDYEVQFPGEVEGVVHADIHSLGCFGGVRMCGLG